MARFYRRRRYYRRGRRYYRSKYRRYRRKYRRMKLANATSRSRTSVKLRSSLDVNIDFDSQALSNKNPLIISPFVEQYEWGDHDIPDGFPSSVYPTYSSLLGDNGVFETYGRLYEEFKLDFMGVKMAITTPINDTSPNPQSVTVTTAWDRKFLAAEASSLIRFEDIDKSPSAMRVTALNNSVAKFNRWIKPSDLQEFINWTDTVWSKASGGALDGTANVPTRFLNTWSQAKWVITAFSPNFIATFKRSNAVDAQTSIRVHLDIVYVVTFRNPRFGAAAGEGQRGADSEGRSDALDRAGRGVLPPGGDGGADAPAGDDADELIDEEDDFSDGDGDGGDDGDRPAPMRKLARVAADVAAEAGPGLCRVNDVMQAAEAAGIQIPGQNLRDAVSMVCTQINHSSDDSVTQRLSNVTAPIIEPWMSENATRVVRQATTLTQAVKGALKAYRRLRPYVSSLVRVPKRRRTDPDAPFYADEAGQPFNLFEHGVQEDLYRDRLREADEFYLRRQRDFNVRAIEGPPRRFVAQWTRSANRELEIPRLILDREYGEYLLALDPGIAREHLARNIAMAWNENRYRGTRRWYGQDALPEAERMLTRLYNVGPNYMYYGTFFNRRTHQEYDVRYTSMYDNGFTVPTNLALRAGINISDADTTTRPSTHYRIFTY
nr:MAG: capsid protein [ssDNA virus sp.]